MRGSSDKLRREVGKELPYGRHQLREPSDITRPGLKEQASKDSR